MSPGQLVRDLPDVHELQTERTHPVQQGVQADLIQVTATVLCGDLDQVRLHALLDRVRAFGLELMDIRQVPDQLSG